MIKNYLVIAIRSLLKDRVYTFINIFGLSLGLACSLLILLWVEDELSYDKFIPKSEKLYQLYVNAWFDEDIGSWRSVPLPSYMEMKNHNNSIVNSTVASWGERILLMVGDTKILQEGHFVGEEFLEMFEYELVNGDKTVALDEPYSIVITQSLAKSLFADQNPVGKYIRFNNENDLKVTGILKDVPSNSSFQFNYLVPWSYFRQTVPWVKNNEDNWGNYSYQVYVELNSSSEMANVNGTLKDLLTEKGQDDIKRELFLHPMEDWRLNSNFKAGIPDGGMIDYVNLFTAIAIFILLIACINFMNLATARSERRAREVGVRKSVGSRKIDLVVQFIGESMLISTISFVIALVLAFVVLPQYNLLVEKQLVIDLASQEFWIYSIGAILFTGLIAGSYPAFYISSFKPIDVLKGKLTSGKSGSLPRKILVVLQFSVAVILIVSTWVILDQIDLVNKRELGYTKENLITVQFNDELENSYEVLKNELIQSGAAETLTRSNSSITSVNSNNFLSWPGKPEEQKVMFVTVVSEYDYAETMGIKVLEGRDFSKDFPTDTSAIIVNKAALEIMKLEDPIGTEVTLWGDKRPIVGVLDDVLMGSVFEPVRPMMLIIDDWGGSITVRIPAETDISTNLAEVETIFKKHAPNHPFEYKFVDDDFEKKFATINLTKNLAGVFSFLAIVITGLGLIGLASYTASKRTKEIGIRKVMGANIGGLIFLISKDFSKLVLVSFIFSIPVSWYLMNNFLDRYTIRTEIDSVIFIITGIVVLLFALSIVSFQAFKAANSNPVNSLRDN